MPKKTKMIHGIANWEIIAFFIINKLLVGNNSFFSRSELMTQKHLDLAVNFSRILKHKKDPQRPEETLQRTIQNLRDKGLIEFLGRGEYKLTEDGVKFAVEIEKRYPSRKLWDAIANL